MEVIASKKYQCVVEIKEGKSKDGNQFTFASIGVITPLGITVNCKAVDYTAQDLLIALTKQAK